MPNHLLCSCEWQHSCGDDKVFCSSPWSCANCATVWLTIFCALVSMIASVWTRSLKQTNIIIINPWEEICSRDELGRKSCGWKAFIVSLFNIKKTAQRVWFRWECLQYYSTSCFIIVLWASSFSPLLGRTRSWGRCWAANRLSHHPELSGRAIHEEVDGLDIGRQQGQWFGLLCHTHEPQKQPYPICANRNGNVWHPCGGG